jgi:cytochrome c556
MNHKKIITAFSTLFFILIFSNSAFAQYEGIIKYRKNVMKSTGGHMGAIVDILKNGLPLTAHIVDHAHSINKNNKMTLAMFPKGSGLGDTKAKSTIWENWTKFKNAVDASVRESTKLVKVAEIGDMNAFAKQVRATGKTCRGCHQSFRERN